MSGRNRIKITKAKKLFCRELGKIVKKKKLNGIFLISSKKKCVREKNGKRVLFIFLT